jgi:hypothetical protein
MHPEGERLAGLVGGGLHEGAFVGAGADAQDLGSGDAGSGWSARMSFHVFQNIRPRNPLTTDRIAGHNITMTTTWIHADEIVTGNSIITADRKRPVTVIAQLSAPENAHYFEFACESTNGYCALRLHRSETVQLVTA